jgi:oligo-1,6-glucosidase
MPWRAGPNAGFGTHEPWLPVHADASQAHADALRADPESVFHHYRRLIALRHELPVVAHGDFTMLAPEHERLYAFRRRLDDDTLLVVANWSDTDLPLAGTGAEPPEDADLVLDNLRAGDGPSERGVLRGWEARVYRSKGTAA